MKKRLSLLMVLMMIVSLLPMSAFAAATPGYTTANVKVYDARNVAVGYVFTPGTTVTTGQIRFELDNGAEFDGTITNANVVGTPATPAPNPITVANVNKISSQIIVADITVGVAGANVGQGTHQISFNAPVRFENEGDVNLRVIDNQNTGIGTQTVKVAVVGSRDTSDLAATVTDVEKSISFDGGKLSQFEVKNIPAGTKTLNLEVEEGMNWVTTGTDITTVVGLGGVPTPGLAPHTTDKNVVVLTFASPITAAQEKNGSIVVVPSFGGADRGVTAGNVVVDLEAFDTSTPVKTLATNRITIGKVVDYSVTITAVEKGKKEIPSVWGGEEADVTVTIKGPKGSILNRTVEFTVDGADVKYNSISSISAKPSNASITASGTDDKGVYKNGEFNISAPGNDVTEVKFNMTIVTDGDKDGAVTIKAAQRGWEVTADVAKVTPKFSAKADVTPIKKGEAKDAATITITEAKAGLIARGENLFITFDTRRDYTQITSKGIKVEATNGMTFDTSSSAVKWVQGTDGAPKVGLSIPVTKSSTGEPAVITISGINVSVDGSATDDVVKVKTGLVKRNGNVNTTTSGSTTTPHDRVIVSSIDYVKVVKEYDMESILSVFTIGQTAYTVNGETKAAHSAPYIKAGRTMLPIRAVAESLGLEVQWNSATRTASFTDASKVAAVTIGSKVLYVNGTPMPLTVPAELVNDTTFVELRSLATAFGVQIDWDAAAKTATVSK